MIPLPDLCILLGQLRQQVGAGLDAAVEVGQRELLVRAVEVVVVLAPAEQEGIDAELRLEQADDRDRASFADEDRRLAEPGLDRPGPRRGRPVLFTSTRTAGAPWWSMIS